ncbi:Trypsin [Popillia japonica]|uniref:Trypsin n=1 Tax=Popillia japonica TaxID=7064 RepID=A0AAW1KBD1_POPJA
MRRLRPIIETSKRTLITYIYVTSLIFLECRSDQVFPRGLTFIIGINDNARDEHLCIGTYISLYWVMTNAICAGKAKTSLAPILTASDLVHNHDCQERKPKSYEIHPEYDRSSKINNIALIELWEPFIAGPDIDLILFTNSSRKSASCILIGWQFISTESSYQYSVVMSVKAKKLADEICIDLIKDGDISYVYASNEMVCVAEALCLSEEGAPLVCDGTLFGIMSYTTCTISVIERIEYHRRWIDTITMRITTRGFNSNMASRCDSSPVLLYAAIAAYLRG